MRISLQNTKQRSRAKAREDNESQLRRSLENPVQETQEHLYQRKAYRAYQQRWSIRHRQHRNLPRIRNMGSEEL